MKQSIMNIATLLLACIVFNSFTTVNGKQTLNRETIKKCIICHDFNNQLDNV